MLPLRHYVLILSLVLGLGNVASSQEPLQEPNGDLTLSQALALTLEKNPGLLPFAWDIRAAEAREIQAGLRPNPELSLELEDIRLGGADNESSGRSLSLSPADGLGVGLSGNSESARNSAFGDAQVTISLSQLVELGGKRAKRIEAAKQGREVMAWDYEVARADALADTARAFYHVLAMQESVRLAGELLELAGQSHATIQSLVDAGKVSAIELSRSEVELAQLAIERDAVQRELNAARVELAGHWGNNLPLFTNAVGSFPDTFLPPSADTLHASIEKSPYLKRWTAELDMRDAVVELEKANGKPDLTVMLGARSAGTSGVSGRGWDLSSVDGIAVNRGGNGSDREARIVLGFSLPLPLFNRNQGSIKEAEYLASKAAEQRRAVEAAITNALVASGERATAAHEEVQNLQAKVIPHAMEAFNGVQEGYRAGKFALLDVLTAQRALFDAQRQLSRGQASFQQTIVEIERFTGMPVEPAPLPEATTSVEEKK
jgi:cobalt-zinc-cadmium efflux system outer membrane protein